MSKYFSKTFFVGLNILISISVGLLIPKILGPDLYGQYTYITSFCIFIFQIILLSFNNAYIFYFTNESKDKGVVSTYYLCLISLILVIFSFLIVLIMAVSDAKQAIFPDIDEDVFILLGSIFGALSFIQLRTFDLFDAHKKIFLPELIRTSSRFIIILVALYYIFYEISLSLNAYYIISIVLLFLSILISIIFTRIKYSRVSKDDLKNFSKLFWSYSKPLLYVLIISATYTFLGKFLLQNQGGSIQQGYYNFAYTIATIPVMLISSLMMLFSNDMASQFKEGNLLKASNKMLGFISLGFMIQLFSVGIMFISINWMILNVVGIDFLPSINIVYILGIFSIFHVFGITATATFNSAGKNVLYAKWNIPLIVFSIITLVIFAYKIGFEAISLALFVTGLYILRSLTLFIKSTSLLKVNLQFLMMMIFLGMLASSLVFIFVNYLTIGIINKVMLFSFLYALIVATAYIFKENILLIILKQK